MVESVKITLLICLTCITSSVLILSYNEYTNRYELITTQNNSVYIFDKKTTTLNKCENGKCEVIRVNIPTIGKNTITSVQAVPASNLSTPQISSTQQTNQLVNQNQSAQYFPSQKDAFQQDVISNPQGISNTSQLSSDNEQLPTLQNLQPVTYSKNY